MDNNKIPPGGIILGPRPQDLGVPMPQPRTRTEHHMRSTQIAFDPVVDDDNIVRGYRLYLHDLLEHTYYTFGFSQETLSLLRLRLEELPGEGFPLGECAIHEKRMSNVKEYAP